MILDTDCFAKTLIFLRKLFELLKIEKFPVVSLIELVREKFEFHKQAIRTIKF